MIEPPDLPQNIPNTLRGCRAFIWEQAAAVAQFTTTIGARAATISDQAGTIAAQERTIEELGLEMEKLRKLLSHRRGSSRSWA